MSKWRPEGWHNNETQNMIKDAMKNGHIAGIQGNTMFDIYEAGADAMLEALKNQTSHPQEVLRTSDGKRLGSLVFIPNEEAVDASL